MLHDRGIIKGRFAFTCVTAEGRLRWALGFDNLVTTVGKNLALDAYLSGNPYSVVGPFMGLIAATGFTAISATDTMAAHPGWLEAGLATSPRYSPATRPTIAFAAASAGSKSSNVTGAFSMTQAGSIVGGFLVMGPGATNATDNTGGTLYSAGQFIEGTQVVANGDVVNVSYTASL